MVSNGSRAGERTATAGRRRTKVAEPPQATDAWKNALREHVRRDDETTLPPLDSAIERYGEEIEKAHADYSLRGFSTFPLRLGTKAAHDKAFMRYCQERPKPADLSVWNAKSMFGGLAFALGPASSPDSKYEFVALDFDKPEVAERWLAQAGDLSDCMTNRTKKGMHVCFLARKVNLPRGEGGNVVNLYDERGVGCGELRLRKAYIVAPPTLHPESEPGKLFIYREDEGKGRLADRLGGLTPPELRRVEDARTMLGDALVKSTAAAPRTTPKIRAWLLGVSEGDASDAYARDFDNLRDGAGEVPELHVERTGRRIEKAELLTLAAMDAFNPEHRAFAASFCLPQYVGTRERHSLLYAQHLLVMQNFPAFRAEFKREPALRMAVAREFHGLQDPALRKTVSAVRAELTRAIPKVHTRAGSTSLDYFMAEAERRADPPCLAERVAAWDLDPWDVKLLKLMHVGVEWHLRNTGQRFFLKCSDAGRIIGASHTTAWERLNMLVQDELIRRAIVGNGKARLASEYLLTCDCLDCIKPLEEGV